MHYGVAYESVHSLARGHVIRVVWSAMLDLFWSGGIPIVHGIMTMHQS